MKIRQELANHSNIVIQKEDFQDIPALMLRLEAAFGHQALAPELVEKCKETAALLCWVTLLSD